jgi:hypothetical protein
MSSDSSILIIIFKPRARGRLGERRRSFRGHTLRALQRCSSIGIKQLQQICCDNLRSRQNGKPRRRVRWNSGSRAAQLELAQAVLDNVTNDDVTGVALYPHTPVP